MAVYPSTAYHTLLFIDDILFVHCSNFNQIAQIYNMQISIDKSKIMAFLGKKLVRSKISINNQILKQVKMFNYYLGCQITYEEEKDLNEKNYEI